MKTIFVLCALILVAGSATAWHFTRTPNIYGQLTNAPKAQVADLIASPKDHLHKTFAIEGTITEQCESMGCFFFFVSGKQKLRVDLQDIAMTAPRKMGRPARVEGQIVPYGDGYQFAASGIEFR